jgi:peptidoglycan/LPS O-acetylase OafA/YrhL
MRWVAAAAVVFGHLRALAFVDYADMKNTGMIFRGLFFLAGFGHQAVVVFFVLSGYLVGGEVLAALQNGTFDVRRYAVQRSARLYAVYVVALAFGGLFDWVGIHQFNTNGLYSHHIRFVALDFPVVQRLDVATLLGNLAFCQKLITPTFGSNEPLWSLANEAWYYVMFPLLASALWGTGSARKRFLVAVAFLGTAGFVRGPILLYSSIWLLGLAPRFLPRAIIRWSQIPALAFCAMLVGVRCGWFARMSMFEKDLSVAIAFVLLMNSIEFRRAEPQRPRFAALHKALAGFSYSVYLLHWPFALLIVAITQQQFGYGLRMTRLDAGAAAFAVALILGAYGFAYGVAQFTEKQTPSIRAWVLRRLHMPVHASRVGAAPEFT